MKSYKSYGLAAILAIAVLIGLTAPVQAQIGAQSIVVQQGTTNTTVISGGNLWTNSINGGTSFTNMTPVDLTGATEAWLQFRGNISSNNASTGGGIYVWLYKAADNTANGKGGGTRTTWAPYVDTIGLNAGDPVTWTVTLPGTGDPPAVSTTVTNLSLAGQGIRLAPYVYVGIISNGYLGGANLTNFSIKVVTK